MTRSHKIGWLVLAVALLFVLWRLPRLHGQGFGSFSHDQPFLAKDVAASTSIPWPPTPNLAAWWHWEDVNTTGTNWVDRLSGNIWVSSGASAPTNDGTGIYFDGVNSVMTNATFTGNFNTLWWEGVSVYVIASAKGQTNAEVLLSSELPDPNLVGFWSTLTRQTATNFVYKAGVATQQTMFTNIVTGNIVGFAWSLLADNNAMDCYVNGSLERTIANALAHTYTTDNHYIGGQVAGFSRWYGWVYDILVYTNVYRWTTNTAPSIADIYQWQTNWYNRSVTVPYPTNVPNMYPLGWYIGDDGLATNGSVVSWADHSGQSKPLTNAGAQATWPVFTNTALNGHALISFDGVNDIIGTVLISNTQPTEYIMVLSHDGNPTGGYKTIFDSYYPDGTFAQSLFYFETTQSKIGVYAGGPAVTWQFVEWTNKWWIVDVVMNNYQTVIYTNGTLFLPPVPLGSAAMAGIYLAGDITPSTAESQIRVAEFIMYPNVLQPRYRAAITSQLKTKYGL